MNAPFWLSKALMRRTETFFPLSRGVPRVDDRWIVSAIIYVIGAVNPTRTRLHLAERYLEAAQVSS